jgi:hypothetical protein
MTDRDDIISSDHVLSEPERALLRVVLGVIIPGSDDGHMPGAADIDTFSRLDQDTAAVYQHALGMLETACQAQHDKGFAQLAAAQRTELIEGLETQHPELIGMLIGQTFALYYQDDAVVTALGLEPRPPHPGGYDIGVTDWGLLEPVKGRPKMYREPPSSS